jgi:succinoglycan biosynthesis transport protein ExoP
VLEFLALLRRRWRVVVTFVVLGVAANVAVTSQMTPQYEATSQLFVSLTTSDSVSELAQSQLFSAHRVSSYPSLATSPLVLEPVIREVGLTETPAKLAERVTATVPTNTVLIDIKVLDESPERAAELAGAISTELAEVITELDRTSTGGGSPVRVTQVRPAEVGEEPVSPIPLLNLAIGVFGGLGLGLGAAALRDVLDNTIKSDNDIEQAAGLPVLSAIPTKADMSRSPLLGVDNANPGWSEAYRRLRTNVSFLDPDHPPRRLLITSALAAEGKTATAINLAIALSQNGQSTLLIDADLRRPSAAKVLGLVADVGLTTVISGQSQLSDVVQQGPGLDVLTSGPIPPNPSEILGSQAFRKLLDEALASYHTVVIDSPPVIAVTDAAVASAAADAVIVVARARKTTKPDLARAVEALRAVDARVVGAVINRSSAGDGAYYDYTYQSSRPARTRLGRRQREVAR